MSKKIPEISQMFVVVNTQHISFNCPNCGYVFNAHDFVKQVHQSNHGYIHKKCKGCDEWIGITLEFTAIPKVWMKPKNSKHLQVLTEK